MYSPYLPLLLLHLISHQRVIIIIIIPKPIEIHLHHVFIGDGIAVHLIQIRHHVAAIHRHLIVRHLSLLLLLPVAADSFQILQLRMYLTSDYIVYELIFG